MAKQSGIIKIDGTVDDITFYHSQDGFLLRKKTSLNGKRIATDPKFARTRENNEEFGSAAMSSKTLRNTVASMMKTAKDNRVTSRTTEKVKEILKLDFTSARGLRNVGVAVATPSTLALLRGYEFNIKSIMGSVMSAPYVVDVVTGTITIANLIPINNVIAPQEATHLTLKGAYANVNFTNNVTAIDYSNEVNLILDGTSTTVKLIPTAVPAGTGSKLFFMEIEFFQLVNGVQYALSNGTFNSLIIAQVA